MSSGLCRVGEDYEPFQRLKIENRTDLLWAVISMFEGNAHLHSFPSNLAASLKIISV